MGLIYVVAVLLLAALAAWGWASYRHPLDVAAWVNRRRLSRLGLARTTMSAETGTVTYWVGGGRGPTLVLLHGAGDQAGSWARVAAVLRARYRLVVPDLPGHGESAPLTAPLAVGTILSGVWAVVAHETMSGPAIVLGHSLGAWIATLLAAAHPEQVSRLILVNGGAIVGDRPDLTLMPKDRAEAAHVLAELRDPSSRPVPGFLLDDIVRHAQSGPIARMAAAASSMPQYLMDGRLQTVSTPVDLLWGESDHLMSLAYARRMSEALPAARLTTIPRAGHVPQQERPGAFVAALERVLSAPPPAPSAR